MCGSLCFHRLFVCTPVWRNCLCQCYDTILLCTSSPFDTLASSTHRLFAAMMGLAFMHSLTLLGATSERRRVGGIGGNRCRRWTDRKEGSCERSWWLFLLTFSSAAKRARRGDNRAGQSLLQEQPWRMRPHMQGQLQRTRPYIAHRRVTIIHTHTHTTFSSNTR